MSIHPMTDPEDTPTPLEMSLLDNGLSGEELRTREDEE